MDTSETDVDHNKKISSVSTAKPPMRVMDMKNFQDCLDTCGFGKYQCKIMFAVFFQAVAGSLALTNFSYVLPNAECDLHMTIYQKGILTGAPFIGMLSSGCLAGFLTDTYGRKIVLTFSLFGIFASTCIQGTSQTFVILVIAKTVEGFLFNGAYSAGTAFISEFTTSKTRDHVILVTSSFTPLGQIVVALIAWAILPRKWDVEIFGGALHLHSWNFFLYAGGTFSLIAGIVYSLFPESPKYNFARGRYNEAFVTLQKIYSVNTGKAPETFPYQAPSNDTCGNENERKSTMETIQESLRSLKPMIKKPLFPYLLLLVCMEGTLMFGYNTMRLWYPQISTIVETYKAVGNNSTTLCVMLDSYMATAKNVSTTILGNQECLPNKSGNETYINAITMGIICCIPYIFSGFIINFVGKRALMVIYMTICTGTCAGLYWATNSIQVAVLVSTFVALAQTSIGIMLTVALAVFPTVTKSVAISVMYTNGRLASLIGNIIFPIMLAQDCLVPFVTIASVMCFAAFLALLLPVDKK